MVALTGPPSARSGGYDGGGYDGGGFSDGNVDGPGLDGPGFDDAGYEGGDYWGQDGDAAGPGDGRPDVRVPVLAVVGRPNVGKSTLVNRILGSRQAVVQDVPGVTRDRVTYDASWRGRAFTVVDTGGWEPFPGAEEGQARRELAEQVTAQARVAVEAADAVLFVLDAVVGVTDADDAVAAVLRRAGKPVVVAANKVDDAIAEPAATALWSLGLGEPQPVSALHGRGSGDLLDAVLAALPETPRERIGEAGGPRRVALIGRPNVGKSSLLNKLAGQTRALVDEVAGTTRDPVDELIELGGTTWRFVDTAGIRRAGQPEPGRGFLRRAAHRRGAGAGRGGRGPGRRERAAHRAGPADHLDGHRRRAVPGHRLQQVGPGR